MGDGHRLAATASPGGYLKEGVKRWWSAALEGPGQALRGLGAEVVLDLVDLGAEELLLPTYFRHVVVVLLLERADLAVHVRTRGVAALVAAPMRALGGPAPAGVAGGHVAGVAGEGGLGSHVAVQDAGGQRPSTPVDRSREVGRVHDGFLVQAHVADVRRTDAGEARPAHVSPDLFARPTAHELGVALEQDRLFVRLFDLHAVGPEFPAKVVEGLPAGRPADVRLTVALAALAVALQVLEHAGHLAVVRRADRMLGVLVAGVGLLAPALLLGELEGLVQVLALDLLLLDRLLLELQLELQLRLADLLLVGLLRLLLLFGRRLLVLPETRDAAAGADGEHDGHEPHGQGSDVPHGKPPWERWLLWQNCRL